jgi:hypothetical protein
LRAIYLRVKRLGLEADHFHLEPMSAMVELYFHSPIRLHGVVLNQLRVSVFSLPRWDIKIPPTFDFVTAAYNFIIVAPYFKIQYLKHVSL